MSPIQTHGGHAYPAQTYDAPSTMQNYRVQPASPSVSNTPATNGVRSSSHDRASSTFYDPTAETRNRQMSWSGPSQQPRSPISKHHSSNHSPSRPECKSSNSDQTLPGPAHKSHSSSIYTHSQHGHVLSTSEHSPRSPILKRLLSNQTMGPPPTTTAACDRAPVMPSARVNDPMSFSSILSTSDPTPPNPASTSVQSYSKPSRSSTGQHSDEQGRSRILDLHTASAENGLKDAGRAVNGHVVDGMRILPPTTTFATSRSRFEPHSKAPNDGKFEASAGTGMSQPTPARVRRPRLIISEKDLESALAKIDAMELSDVEGPGFEKEREAYAERSAKRTLEVDASEAVQRKRRRIAYLTKIEATFAQQAASVKERYIQTHEQAAWQKINDAEVADEKERKKVMQRTRRWETTKQKAEQHVAELKQRAQKTDDRTEQDKLLREVQRAEKKVLDTDKLLNGETFTKDLREKTPVLSNIAGGVLSAFQMDDLNAQEQPKKPSRTGGRLKKSREQKQAEKDRAAAHAITERGDEPVLIAPKREPGVTMKLDLHVPKNSHSGSHGLTSSSVYNQIYEQIWRDIARNHVYKVYRIKENSLATKQSNLRKTGQLAAKEARRWQLKTNKSTKDTQARAKRVMREMLSFWKRNERDERDQRKIAEKQELDNAKKAEADREANRQKRKLNFLISQTELYSHFIGKKVKTDEVERSTDDVTASDQSSITGRANTRAIDLPDDVGEIGAKVTNFDDLDFDAEDDTVLRNAAMANAQNAIREAQDRARAFDQEGQQLQAQFDEGEMNFQNPTSLGDVDIAQPKMLSCQLKEYQLKGLNWLVNLYEQGINGILADEMGLGKTIQSISVMAYLAEAHNIWGPFLVIAPASTLHNWQQEIVRFVPNLKVLPYWGNAKDRKVLRKFWDRKHITYTKDSPFHVLVTSYQLVVQDTQYFQKIRWQYMILDEAQAIKSSQSSRWKSLLGFHCRNRLLLTGTPIQNNMQELWALLHFIMPSLFDSHDEFSDWFSKDIESHAQSNTKLNEDQLKRLHMILKPFMLRRIKKHVQKELGDKIEMDVFCDLTYRQRAYYSNLRNKISIIDLLEKVAVGDDQDAATLMNLVMQFRKVCNHPDLFERAEVTSPVSFSHFAETASFLREGNNIQVGYSVRNLIEFQIPRLIGNGGGRIDLPGPDNPIAGWRTRYLHNMMNIWTPDNIHNTSVGSGAFSWLRFVDTSPSEIASMAHQDVFQRAIARWRKARRPAQFDVTGEIEEIRTCTPLLSLFNVVEAKQHTARDRDWGDGRLHDLMNISSSTFVNESLNAIEPCSRPAASAPPIELYCASQAVIKEKQRTFFNVSFRTAVYNISLKTEQALLEAKVDPSQYPVTNLLPSPISEKSRYTKIQVPSMRRFVTDSGKLAKLDQLLAQLKEGGHRVLLYFQMTRMIDLMEEYLTYRNYKYCRLDGSTKLEDRRDTVADFQSRPDIFIFLLSTRAGGLGINLTAADTVIFYDSDWNPTIDSQAMDRAHRLGQTKQVTVYRMITRGTIEERIRRRALQKEEVQRVVISGGAGVGQVDFNTRSTRENRTKDIAMWLADEDQAKEIEKKEAELAEKEAKEGEKKGKGKKGASAGTKRKAEVSLDDMYHEGEGHFDDSSKPSGTATPIEVPAKTKRKGVSKKAKTVKEKLAIADGAG